LKGGRGVVFYGPPERDKHTENPVAGT